jgi:hypothetical protein
VLGLVANGVYLRQCTVQQTKSTSNRNAFNGTNATCPVPLCNFLWLLTRLATEQRRSLLLLSSSLYVVNCCKPNKIVHIYCKGRGEGVRPLKVHSEQYTVYMLRFICSFVCIRLTR